MLRFPVPGAPLTPTDNERTLMKPLIRILEKAGIRWGIGCADWLPIDPQHCAAEIGLNLRHVKLSEIGDTAELEAFFDEFANPEAPCLFLSDIDVPVLAAWDDEEEREAMRGIIVRGLARIAATHGHHFIVTGLTSLTKDICREAFENAEPLAPHETEELFTISHEQVGLLYGADLARISEERTMVPDLVMMELDRHAALGARYVEPYILQWVRQGKAGILPPVSGALTPRFLERLQNAGLMDLKRMALFQEIPAVFGKDRLDLLAEAMVTLGFWTPLPAGAADEQPDDVRLYDYAAVWGVRLLAVLALRFVMSEGADWMTPTRELMRAMWSGEPNEAMDALCEMLDCIEDQDADLDIGGLCAACILALDLDLTRVVNEDEGLDILAVRLPGGICELVFAPEDRDPAELGSPDGTPRMVLTIG